METRTVEQAAAAALRTAGDEATRSEAARQMGAARSEKKAVAVRENGKKGGRPPGTPMTEEHRERIRQGRLAGEARRRAESQQAQP